jgi:hypothetical protein
MLRVATREWGNWCALVDRALDLLHLFVGPSNSWTLTEIARQSELTVSTAYRLLKTLLAHELIGFDSETRLYTIDVEAIRLARSLIEDEDRYRLQFPAHRELERLRELSGETVGLHSCGAKPGLHPSCRRLGRKRRSDLIRCWTSTTTAATAVLREISRRPPAGWRRIALSTGSKTN